MLRDFMQSLLVFSEKLIDILTMSSAMTTSEISATDHVVASQEYSSFTRGRSQPLTCHTMKDNGGLVFRFTSPNSHYSTP